MAQDLNVKCPYCGYKQEHKPREHEGMRGFFYAFNAPGVTEEPMRRGSSYQEEKNSIKGCPRCGGLFLKWVDSEL